MTIHHTYTVELDETFAAQYEEWRPITDLADEIKVVTHDDGTAELYFRVKPKDHVHFNFSTNGAGEPK